MNNKPYRIRSRGGNMTRTQFDFGQCFWARGVALVAFISVFGALAASAQQTVTLQPLLPKIVTGANFTHTNAYMLPIAVTFGGGNNPVNFAAVGLPPGATGSFSTNGITNSQTINFFVNVAGIVKGVYPVTIHASGGAIAATTVDLIAGQLWSASNLGNANWSVATNWSSGLVTGPGDHVKFEDAGVRTNIVNTSVTIDSLTYARFLSGTNQTTVIPAGNTLSVVGTGGFSANVEGQPGSNKTTTINISGGGSLIVSNESANFAVNALNGGNAGTTLDMSGLSNFTATVSRFGIGDVTLAQAGSVGAHHKLDPGFPQWPGLQQRFRQHTEPWCREPVFCGQLYGSPRACRRRKQYRAIQSGVSHQFAERRFPQYERWAYDPFWIGRR
jgi:hypothetical protein